MSILLTRTLKVAGIMGVLLGVITLAINSDEAFAALAGVLTLVIASSALWLYFEGDRPVDGYSRRHRSGVRWQGRFREAGVENRRYRVRHDADLEGLQASW